MTLNGWVSLKREDELIKHIQHHFHVKYDGTGSGSVHLDERMQQDSQSPRDNDKGMNSTEKDSSEGVHAALTGRPDGPSAFPNPMEGEDEQMLRVKVVSAAVSMEVVEQSGTNNMVTRPPNDVTAYIKGKGSFPGTWGTFANVYKCVLDKPGEPRAVVAVKALKPGARDATVLQARGNKLRGEVHIWIRLDHPNVLKLHGITDGFPPLPALVSPWVENGNLTRYLADPGRDISKEERITILVRVGEALHYIHSPPHHIVHGGLKGSNILIDGDGQPLISDFALASIFDDDNPNLYRYIPGAIRWLAPELLRALEESPKPSTESDVYSFGCVMFHTLSGKVPYSEIREYHILSAKMNNICPQRPTDLPIQDTVWKWIELCLDATPENRPKLPDIIRFLSKVRL
ncbi:kinase-like protein [Paxillus ammoniavirescens]|nr:kinase-like protein [Paxillus ammoniavirescens]